MEREPQKEPSLYKELVKMFGKFDSHGRYAEAERVCYVMFNVAPEKQGEILYRLGLTWWRVGEIDLAEQLFLQADESLVTRDPMRIRISNELSLLYQARGAWIGPYGSLIGWAGLLEGRKRLVRNRHLVHALGSSGLSLGLWKNLYREFKNTPEGQNLRTNSLDVQGLVYTAGGLFNLAEDNHLKIIEEASQIGDKVAVACARNNLGLAYFFEARQRPTKRQELLAKAEECFRKRLEEDENKTSVGYAIALSNLARVLEAQGTFLFSQGRVAEAEAKDEEAWKIYHKCLWFAKKTGQTILMNDAQYRINYQLLYPKVKRNMS